MLDVINDVLWFVVNVLAFVASVTIVVATIAYYAFFDPRATTAGKMIFRFMVSLSGVIVIGAVAKLTGVTEETTWWLILALLVYAYLAFTVISLAVFLAIRKWKPQKFKKKSDVNVVKPRTETTEIPIVKKHN